jgi:hypothetical protein
VLPTFGEQGPSVSSAVLGLGMRPQWWYLSVWWHVYPRMDRWQDRSSRRTAEARPQEDAFLKQGAS